MSLKLRICKWRKLALSFGLVMFFIFSKNFVFGQTTSENIVMTTTATTPTESGQKYKDVDFSNLKAMGFVESTRKDLIPILKVSLDLNDNQINQIAVLRTLYKDEDQLAYFDFYFNHIQEMSNDPTRKADPAKVQKNKQALDEKIKECIDQTQVLKDLMGNKFDELCLWIKEISVIQSGVLSNFQNNRNIEADDATSKIWEKFKTQKEYPVLIEVLNRTSVSKNRFDASLNNHETLFRLMAKYEFYMESPRNSRGITKKREFEDQKNKTFMELTVSK
jgi:hypothetical protein